MDIKEVQGLIEKSILSGKQIVIEYTKKGKKEKKKYALATITRTWGDYFNTIVLTDGGRGVSKRFLYSGISGVETTDQDFHPNDNLIEKLKDGSLFSDEDIGVQRKGGLKGYPSSINYVSKVHQTISKEEVSKLFEQIDLPHLDGWERAVMLNIEDGDTFDLLLERDQKFAYTSRLYGADAPETSETSPDYVLGLEAKIFVEDLFSENRFCYVRELGKEAYGRYLVSILTHDKKNLAIELLSSGLGVPMMGYVTSKEERKLFEEVTMNACNNRIGIWSIEEVYQRVANILLDTNQTEIDIFGHIPEKKSAIQRYLKQNPKAKIIYEAAERKKSSNASKKIAANIVEKMMRDVDGAGYDVEELKKVCDIYLAEINAIEEIAKNKEVVKDCIMHVEDLIDEYELGDGLVKGNFSKGKKRLVYHSDPEDRWYKLCIPEIMFRSVEDAKKCGFKKR